MSTLGPAAFRKSVESRQLRSDQHMLRKVRALLTAIDKAEKDAVNVAEKKVRGIVKGVVPYAAWQEVLQAAKALRGV